SEVREQGKGRERADYERFAGILAAAGYRGFVALEFEAEGDPMVEVPKELDRLRKALESV
ncbi:MAG TPA: sugar phosphate isomerase/epimerase, partial [Planctomycetota bacterium]|nr:sugar phosphate isomerase/epimerase [Planctomycetota bacterium]